MDQDQAQHMFAAMAGMMGLFAIFGLAVVAFTIFLFWRILAKAGLPGPLAFLILFPAIGPLIVICILAFSEWKVVPAPQAYPPPYYPPPPPPQYPPPPPPPSVGFSGGHGG
jgi:uncharacterized membrane protein YhaH (DUF805 family)